MHRMHKSHDFQVRDDNHTCKKQNGLFFLFFSDGFGLRGPVIQKLVRFTRKALLPLS